MTDMTGTIVAKSDQLNADELLPGSRTLEITSVEVRTGDQPVSIHYRGENGHPYKPCKNMRRILVALWGGDGANYIGKSITVFRDPDVKFGGMAVGGIVISHASHITEPLSIALAVTKGKKKIYTVEPLAAAKPAAQQQQLDQLPAEWSSWSNEERGYNRASLGTAALVAWWRTLTADERTALEDKKDSEWKPLAAGKDGAK